jgi:preprotein translocase subunit SecA
MKAEIPVQDSDEVQEARAQKRQRLNEKKEESRSLLQGGGEAHQPAHQRTEEKVMPVRSEKLANRNDKVTVQYADGRVMKDVKYKKVEDDIKAGRCIVIDQ